MSVTEAAFSARPNGRDLSTRPASTATVNSA